VPYSQRTTCLHKNRTRCQNRTTPEIKELIQRYKNYLLIALHLLLFNLSFISSIIISYKS